MNDPNAGGRLLELALRLLTRRDHGSAELAQKLARRGFPEEEVLPVISRLEEKGYLDDRRFARRWAEGAVESGRGYGNRVRFELTRRGVAATIIGEVLDELLAVHDEESTLAALVRRKYPRYDPAAATEGEKRRLWLFLKRRGFSGSAIATFIRNGHGDDLTEPAYTGGKD